ncbi:MAG TPA: class I SAM-dependent methyltransferase [Streptosporangiaceae bacterium]|nr:class I SAM-dependent methyltransferase [Streptosporangiaceae bacterium]
MADSPFDAVAGYYDVARPSYPDSLFEAIEKITGPLAGQVVLDGCAGTGIATRQLSARGALVTGYDIGEAMLRRAIARSPELPFVITNGNLLPFRDGRADLACFAQSWHWLDQDLASREVARVLRPGGHWAAWWNQSVPDGEDWHSAYQDALEAACPRYAREHANTDWCLEAIAGTGLFEPGMRLTVPWTRMVTVRDWITEQRSKSYVSVLAPGEREFLLARIARITGERFPDGQMTVPYATGAWIARRR